MFKRLEHKLLFTPTPAFADWHDPPARVEDVQFETTKGQRIHAWWYPTPDWQPEHGALLYCHGNAGNLSSRASGLLEWQKALGLAIMIFDYPGYGLSEGQPTERSCYSSAKAAYRWLVRSMQIAGDRIVLFGGSLGGGVATEIACTRPHRALVLSKTFTSIPDVVQSFVPVLPIRWLVHTRFNNLAKIGSCKRPTFIAHGTADRLVPFRLGKRLFDAAPGPKEFLPMEGIGHGGQKSPDFFDRVQAFLNKYAPLNLG